MIHMALPKKKQTFPKQIFFVCRLVWLIWDKREIHHSQHIFQFFSTSWNFISWMVCMFCSTFSLISSVVWNWQPLRVNFNFWNKTSLPYLKHWYHSWHCDGWKNCSYGPVEALGKVSVKVLPKLKHNFMQTHCSSRSFIALQMLHCSSRSFIAQPVRSHQVHHKDVHFTTWRLMT